MGLLQYRPKLSNQHTVFPFVRYGVLIGSFSRSSPKIVSDRLMAVMPGLMARKVWVAGKKNHRSVVSQSWALDNSILSEHSSGAIIAYIF